MTTLGGATLKAPWDGMKEVTKDEFYAFVGPRDIVVNAEGQSSGEFGHYAVFKTRSGRVVGYCYGSNGYNDRDTKYALSVEAL